MLLQAETFASAHYNTAYHLLAAALHCAEDEHDPEHLLHVSALAAQQLHWIDLHAPAYEHSTQSAATRGHSSIYAMLETQAHARVVILKHQQRKAPAPRFRPADADPLKP